MMGANCATEACAVKREESVREMTRRLMDVQAETNAFLRELYVNVHGRPWTEAEAGCVTCLVDAMRETIKVAEENLGMARELLASV